MAKVLIIGSGGREHALGWKISNSEDVACVLYAPGNAGTHEAKGLNIPIDGTKEKHFPAVKSLIDSTKIDLVLVGPEAPLAAGLVDYLNSQGYNHVFGPTKKAAMLEADKFFSYDLNERLKIPQAYGIKCKTLESAKNAIDAIATDKGVVIKARGLASGKGVIVSDSKKEALEEVVNLANVYGTEMLVSERLYGEEFSVFGISDGEKVLPIKISFQDHKRQFDNDIGLNTGGMGAYGPAPVAPQSLVCNIAEKVLNPVVRMMKEMNSEYKGFIYAGIMMTKSGWKVLEYNVRFGDPECQPAMMMLDCDLFHAISSALDGKLDKISIGYHHGAACCVVLASQGYPGEYEKGFAISGLEDVARLKNIKVFHSGTKCFENEIVSDGGRVLGVTCYSPNGIADAVNLAYSACEKITILGGFMYRKDIAKKAIR